MRETVRLAQEVYWQLKEVHGKLPRGSWQSVVRWAAKWRGHDFDISQFDPHAVDAQNVYESLMRYYPPPPRDPDYTDVLEQQLAAGMPPELAAGEVLQLYRQRKISYREYLRARRLLKNYGFDWGEIDKKRRQRAARRRMSELDALEFAKTRGAVAAFFGAEPLKKSEKKSEKRREEKKTERERSADDVLSGAWVVYEEHTPGYEKRVKIRHDVWRTGRKKKRKGERVVLRHKYAPLV
ncbi:MAG: hypothetical protein QXT27_06630 [Pyrobaculum sp.]